MGVGARDHKGRKSVWLLSTQRPVTAAAAAATAATAAACYG